MTLGVGTSVLSFRLRNISQKRRNRLRRLKEISCEQSGFRHKHTHTRDSRVWQLCVVIPLAKPFAGTKEKVEKVKDCVVHREGTEEGRTKIRYVLRYYLYNCNAIAFHHALSSCLIGFPFFTHMRSVHFSA